MSFFFESLFHCAVFVRVRLSFLLFIFHFVLSFCRALWPSSVFHVWLPAFGDDPERTGARASGVDDPERTVARTSGVDDPERTGARTSSVDDPRRTVARTYGVDDPEHTIAHLRR